MSSVHMSTARWARWRSEHAALERVLVNAVVLTVICILAWLPGTGAGTATAFAVTSWAPLLVRARYPVAALSAAAAVDTARLGLTTLLPPEPFTVLPVATLVAAVTLAARRRPAVSWSAGLIVAATLFFVGLARQGPERLAELAFMVDTVVAATAVGFLARTRRVRLATVLARAETAERDREEEARRRVAAERVRIARELHDVLAHHLTLVHAQASVAEHLMASDPGSAATALHGIAAHTRQALDEVRMTVGLLREVLEPSGIEDPSPRDMTVAHHAVRPADALAERTSPFAPADAGAKEESRRPAPTLADVAELVTAFRAAGGTVVSTTQGTAMKLTPAAELSVYRIVQEALTNARKHAPGGPVTVSLTWLPEALRVRVWSGQSRSHPQGPPTATHANDQGGVSRGFGLIGMQERAAIAGGAVTAEPSDVDGLDGFLVTVTVPAATPDAVLATDREVAAS